jgi:hypothetical protein
MALKKQAHLGVDEITTGSYHLSALEYASLGVPCFANTDSLTDKVVKDLTGCLEVPWIKASHDSFETILRGLIRNKEHLLDAGVKTREWMISNWSPDKLKPHYTSMYEKL